MKKLLIAITLLALAAPAVQADVLWNQPFVPGTGGYWDSENGCGGFMGQSTVHAASDFRIWDQVTVNQITTYYGTMMWEIESVTQAYLYIGPKTGSIPVDDVDEVNDDALLVPVTVTMVDDGGNWSYNVVASGLNIVLGPGDYWVSLTPANYSVGPSGPNYHLYAQDFWGDPSAQKEYCGMFAPAWLVNYPTQDASILIEGTIDVVPTENESWSDLKADFR